MGEAESSVTLVGPSFAGEAGSSDVTWISLYAACKARGCMAYSIYRGAALRQVRIKLVVGQPALYALEDVLRLEPPRAKYRRKGAKLASP
jgi:hypothetical protein